MKNPELINKAVNVLKEIKEVEAVVLFGSYAKGTETKTSDIDLLIVVDVEKPQELLPLIINNISKIDKEGKISPRITNLRDYDPNFILNVFRDGKILHGKAILNSENMMLKPYRLVYYNISNLEPSKKVLISKRIHGSETLVGNKKYSYKGIKDLYGFEVIGKSLVLVPEKNFEHFKVFLDFNGVKYTEKKLWME